MSLARIAATATLAVLCSSSLASAAITGAAASKELRDSKRIHLKEMRDAMNAPTSDFFDAVATYEALVKDGTATIADFQDVVTAYDVMQGFVRDSMDDAWSAFFVDASLLLQDFATGDDYDGTFPKGFYSGTSGPLDDFYDGAAKLVAKQMARVERRLAVMVKRVASAGISIQFFVSAPGELRRASLTDVTFDAAPYAAFGVDGLFAHSTDAGGDGTMLACGCTGAAVGDIEVEVDGDTEVILAPAAGARWSLLSIAGDLDPNNYLVTASRGDVTVSLAIGIR